MDGANFKIVILIKELWIYGAIAAALASPPARLKNQIEMLDGGGNYSAAILPIVEGKRQYVLMAFCDITGNRPREERWLSPPFAMASISYPDRQVQWRDTKANDFGLTTVHHPGDAIERLGKIDRTGMSIDELSNARSRYPQLISLVVEQQWLLTAYPTMAEEQATARELQECARILYDKPLLPYYQHVGRHFLAWMERAAK